MKRKMISLVLAFTMVLSTTGCASAVNNTFSDISADAWYSEAVEYVQENGLMTGVDADTFSPDSSISRAMLVTVLWRRAGEPAATGSISFDDTTAGAWYEKALSWAVEQKIITGYGNGKFGPNDPVSREQMATILWRMAGSPEVENVEPFADQAAISKYAVNAVIWARAEGIISGKGGNTFDPKGNTSRAETAAIIYREAQAEEVTAPTETSTPPTSSPTTSQRPSGGNSGGGSSGGGSSGGGNDGGSVTPVPTPTPTPTPEEHSNILVAYFSYTNHTEDVAEKIAATTKGDLFEIIPAEAYPDDTSNYYDSETRAYQEQNNTNARPTIAADCAVEDWDNYDVVFVGYPIWYGAPPKIIYTFLESYDFSGKTVVAFSTSSSSGHNDAALKSLTNGATWLTGHRFDIGASRSNVNTWLNTLEYSQPNEEEPAVDKLYVSFNGHTYTATLAENSTVNAFIQHIRDNGGSITLSASEYGGFEKVAPLGVSLPTNNSQTTTQAGDFVLYSGNQIVLFYGSNSWSYTRLGKLDGDLSNLKADLGSGTVSITYSLKAEMPAPSVAVFDLGSGTNGNAPTVTLNSGYEMPVAGIGTYSLKGEECVNSIKSALEQGVRLIDTAYMYGNEAEVGQAVREFMAESGTSREEIFVITKIYPGEQFSDPEKAIQDALDKLNIGYIDMMLLHHPGAGDVKAYKAIEAAIGEGSIRSAGLSNWYIEEIDDFIAQINIKPALVQNEIHPYYQEQKVIPYMHDLGIVMQAWYPLGGPGPSAGTFE